MLSFEWASINDQQRKSYGDLQEATEYGACGVAILVVLETMGLVVQSRSAKGRGFDYWLGPNEQVDESLPFQGTTRLEVSGIMKGSATEVESRTRQKLQQVSISDHLGPACVVIVEFSAPIARVELK